MIDRYKQLAEPQARAFLTGVLDNAVDMAVTHWYFMERRTREQDDDGILTDSRLQEYDLAQMEMALYGHARSLAGDDVSGSDPEPLSWSPRAREGLSRMSRRLGITGMAQCADRNRIFHGLEEQTEIFDEAMENRFVLAGPPIEASTREEYAVRVALREITLDFTKISGQQE